MADLKNFLADLTALCRKHQIGITGDAVLFLMEGPEDAALEYSADDDSKLFFK